MRRVRLNDNGDDVPPRMVRKSELAKMLGVNAWTIDRYRREKPDFPKPLRFSDQVVVWDLAEVKAWLATVERVK